MMTWCRLQVALRRCATFTSKGYANYSQEVPRITVPQKMLQKLDRQRTKRAIEKSKKVKLSLKTLVLSSNRQEYNHYKGQRYDVFDPKQLASHGWKHRNCPNDHFTLVSHGSNPAWKQDFEREFSEMGLDEDILQFLTDEGIEKPTNIQSMMIPNMLKGQHILSAAETGSGKTYAYLLPVVQTLKREPAVDMNNAPRVIIVVPARELAEQIMGICTKLSCCVDFKPFLLCGGRGDQVRLREPGGQSIDVLVATPGILKRMLSTKRLAISRLTTIILDEADTLLDDSFNPLINSILSKLQVGVSSTPDDVKINDGIQVALVSATYPKGLDTTVGQVLPVNGFMKLTTKSLHHIMPHVPQKFIKMKSLDKLENLLKLLKSKKNMSFLIFCNKNDTCVWLSKTLDEFNINNVCYTGFLSEEERSEQLRTFQERRCDVCVCTDIASRGLDTQGADHVVNFDFPLYISDYIHRAGRVGRVGAAHSGQVTSFVVHVWDVELVWKIEMSARSRKELHNVNANIKRKMSSIIEKKHGLDL